MTPKPSKKSTDTNEPVNFEQSLKRLETIVEQIEHGTVTLDEVMKMYEEGIRISKQCLERLATAELTLKRLSKDARGNFELLDEDMEEEN
jgi:exodeoxyribonuclease VII small subunit